MEVTRQPTFFRYNVQVYDNYYHCCHDRFPAKIHVDIANY